MGTDHDLDRLIDAAARQMARVEPSDALSSGVMDRISAPAAPFARPRLVWGSVVAAMVITAAATFVGVNRTAPSAEAPQRAQGLRLKTEGSGLKAQGSGTEAPVVAVAVAARRAASIVVEETEPTSDAIALDVIAPAPIEVHRLEVTTLASIDPIVIAPLEIEPLSASND